MREITNISNIDKCDNPSYVLVRWVGEITKIISEYPNKDMVFRLMLNNIDENLLTLLEDIPYNIEIIYSSTNLEEEKLKLLRDYKIKNNHNVYILYNINNKTVFDRSMLIYYINRYNLIALLNTSDTNDYKDWYQEMTKYTSKAYVRKLNNKYVESVSIF